MGATVIQPPRAREAGGTLGSLEGLSMKVWVAALASVAALALAACGDDGTRGDADAGDDAGVGLDAGLPFAPAAPQMPVLTPCPAGWREVTDPAGVVYCDPMPATGIATCAPDEAHFPGTPGCARIGSACPIASDWAEDLPAGVPILYVRPGAAGGDGSAAAPFGTIAQAMAASTIGTTIALARGRYAESVRFRPGVSLWGACVAETVIAGTSITDFAVTAQGGSVELRNVTVTGERGGVTAIAGDVRLTDIVVRGTVAMGIVIAGAHLVGSNLLVEDVATAADGRFGRALDVENGATAEVTRLFVRRCRELPVLAQTADLDLSDAVILDTTKNDAGRFGHALAAATRGRLVARRIVIERAATSAVAALGAGSTADVEDIVVRDAGGDDTKASAAVRLDLGAAATIRRLFASGTRGVALFVQDDSGPLRVEDAIVADTHESDVGFARAFESRGGGVAELARLAVVRGVETAAQCHRCSLVASDVWVGEVRVNSRGAGGRGLVAQAGADVTLERIELRSTHEVAMLALDADTRVVASDLRVARIDPRCAGGHSCGGNGVVAALDARVDVTRFHVSGAALSGVVVARDGSLDLREGAISDNVIGANVQVPGYDLSRLQDRVAYERNDVVLDTRELPLPEPGGSGP